MPNLIKHLLILIGLVICSLLMIMGAVYFLQQVKPWFSENIDYVHWIFLGIGASIGWILSEVGVLDMQHRELE